MYKITIEHPEGKGKVEQNFLTKEEKDKYVEQERNFTYKELKEYATAWTLIQRKEARIKLFIARMKFYHLFNQAKQPEDKELA